VSAFRGKSLSFINFAAREINAKSPAMGSVNVLPVDLLSTELRKKKEEEE
jgi:hypothetical protein